MPNEIVRAAEQSKSDMIFIGTNKFGYHPGHTCEIVMRYVFVPVFVTRPHGQPFKTSAKFMVNLDGTLISLLALKFTLRFCHKFCSVQPVMIGSDPKLAALLKEVLASSDHACTVHPVMTVQRDQQVSRTPRALRCSAFFSRSAVVLVQPGAPLMRCMGVDSMQAATLGASQECKQQKVKFCEAFEQQL